MRERKMGEWIYCLVMLFALESVIIVSGCLSLINYSEFLVDKNLNDPFYEIAKWAFAIGIVFLSCSNIAYWLFGINLFDYKKLWSEKK